MKALSPVRGCYEAVCCLSERSLAIARGRSKGPAAEEPLSLLDDMNHCYSRLRELVPGVPRGTQLSQVEILQRVIDYILDLQVVLAEPVPGPPDGPHLPIQVSLEAGAGLNTQARMLPAPWSARLPCVTLPSFPLLSDSRTRSGTCHLQRQKELLPLTRPCRDTSRTQVLAPVRPGTPGTSCRKPDGMDGPQLRPAHFTKPLPGG
ncbi:PREDICTED: DNA-binding protein inhibitor ID-3 isoform X1 [Mandrillus leucophaeus]|uniref:DNA-binding protein inhibitor ID-3 isoform X1 n=1 Tax=Mandrillus leucophaeus TaxID=9568 RepID=UPI0005F5346D|nr:PREDICTED: DNA-binding protein inhibitor ID-3 isoform X1 [Mandrillus leucophaeus]